MDHQLKEKVREALLQRCLKKGGSFKLASGKESSVYVDSKGITLHAPSLKILSQYFWQVWNSLRVNPSVIAGVSVGGDPLATALALEGMESGEKNILLVRKEKKIMEELKEELLKDLKHRISRDHFSWLRM
jgi:orotate phosphoribosyltransferase